MLTLLFRKEDIYDCHVDGLEVHTCFRPNDVVLARVLSLGDSRSYYLSTAGLELGVVHALSAEGHPMIPISWQSMQCPTTKFIEARKVAKPS